ncbi:MAG: beta-propeller fold lactonase family protein, partial [bacterium]
MKIIEIIKRYIWMFGIFLALADVAGAYTTKSVDGHTIKWNTNTINMRADEDSFPSEDAYEEALELVIDRLNDNPSKFTINLSFGDTDVEMDNDENEFWFSTDPEEIGTAPAVTHTWYYSSDGRIAETDVVFDPNEGYTPGFFKSEMSPYGGTYRPFWTTATHELGHVFGLGHTTDVYGIMGQDWDHIYSNWVFALGYFGEDASDGAVELYGSASSPMQDVSVVHWRWIGTSSSGYSQHDRTRIFDSDDNELDKVSGEYEPRYEVRRGQTVQVEFTYENNGSNSQTVQVGLYLSTNDLITTGDRRLAGRTPTLGRNEVYTRTYSVTIPFDISADSDYYIGAIVDEGDSIEEGDFWEGNNATYIGIHTKPFEIGSIHELDFNLLHDYSNVVRNVADLGILSQITISQDNRFLSVVGQNSDTVASFSRDPKTGLLELIDSDSGSGDLKRPGSSVISPDDEFLYVGGEDSVVRIFDRDPKTGGFKQKEVFTVEPVLPGGQPLDLTISPDGLFLYAAPIGQERILIHTRDQETGSLTFAKLIRVDGPDVTIPAQIQDISNSPDGRLVYALLDGGNRLISFDRNSRSGNLVVKQKLDLSSAEISAEWQEMRTSPSGDELVLLASKTGQVALVNRDRMTDQLSFRPAKDDEFMLNGTDLSWDPAAGHAFVLSPRGISVFALDGKGGDVTLREKITGEEWKDFVNPVTMVVSDDGRFLYVATRGNDTVPPGLHAIEIVRTPSSQPTPGLNGLDLLVTDFEMKGSAILRAGETIGERLFAELKNRGNMTSEDFAVGVYLSADPEAAASGLPTGKRQIQAGLVAGASAPANIAPDLAIPTDIAPGLYYLTIVLDELDANAELNETNNTASLPVLIRRAGPDLTATEFRLSGPRAVAAGEAIGSRVSVLTDNIGNEASNDFMIGFYISTDPEITPDDLPLTSGREKETSLAANAGVTVRVSPEMAIPMDIKPGTYYLGVIVDDQGSNDE